MNNLDEFHKMLTANPDIESIIGAVLRDIFYTSYERAFGQPSADIRAKVDQADAQTIAEWLPNFVRVRNSTDLFVSSLEHAIAKYGACFWREILASRLARCMACPMFSKCCSGNHPMHSESQRTSRRRMVVGETAFPPTGQRERLLDARHSCATCCSTKALSTRAALSPNRPRRAPRPPLWTNSTPGPNASSMRPHR